ncbi:nickel-responsive transcriptional regulator NikR [Euryarchaeota archaeon ex4484_162]|nr:MAG: nickel-responsive transcriptional regulator NikR [Thermoplasmata archaeon]MCD6108363.1 nickel-responsive transcriptional regulator NikR [Thermoplasmata archaeon]OYT58157.1 MAG: nickel-responsive transcriptional regulator NikR [Euryarchaeota archaeon ex4484_162]RLF31093.1 MAG: nickel-responsive transcriptional regulator NikR [Thermoplasmata archaeon]RLF62119.1 MAG: nickel-responsive transcriptional regulator NikR [Thermoplasmata archaeon]
MKKIIRFGVSIDSELLKKFDKVIHKKGYFNRSEAIRDLIRDNLIEEEWKDKEKEVAGTITIIFDHNVGNIPNKLLDIQHKHHENIVSTTHVHIDEESCLEVLVVEGKPSEIIRLADKLKSMKGVKQGKLVMSSKKI